MRRDGAHWQDHRSVIWSLYSCSAAPTFLGEDALEREPQTVEEPYVDPSLEPPSPEAPPPGTRVLSWFESTLILAAPPTLPGHLTQGEPRPGRDDNVAVG